MILLEAIKSLVGMLNNDELGQLYEHLKMLMRESGEIHNH